MRRSLALALLTLTVVPSEAADYLRGPLPEPAARVSEPPAYDWSGFTITGMGLYGTGKADQSRLANNTAMSAFPDLGGTSAIASLANFGRPNLRGNGFSVAVGYNTMWDDVVVGVEAEYSRMGGTGTSSFGPITRNVYSDTSNSWDTTLSGEARTRVRDYMVGRMKVGAAYDRFLPFVTLGVAAGRVTSNAHVYGTTQQYYNDLDPTTSLPRSTAASGVIVGDGRTKTGSYTWGYALGLGMDVAITDNIFLRGQYEYLGFGSNNNAHVGLNTFKGGAGVKF
ncbi:MAG: outer membrane beta-barrel protein [Proteobacteria bacterium]|nr:outer membrane beta-barrel protein [Pseudomonadota bacterium]